MNYKMMAAMLATNTFTLKTAHVGTDYIFGKGVDIDLAWLVSDRERAINVLTNAGFTQEGKEGYASSHFTSLRSGDFNVIVMSDRAEFDKFVSAAEVCRFLADTVARDLVSKKEVRIKLHDIIMRGERA